MTQPLDSPSQKEQELLKKISPQMNPWAVGNLSSIKISDTAHDQRKLTCEVNEGPHLQPSA